MATRPLSPAARSRLRDGCLVWAAVALVVVLVLASWWIPDQARYVTGIPYTVLLLAGTAALLVAGVRGRTAAHRTNRRDDALADALTAQLDQLVRHGRDTAYAGGAGAAEVAGGRVVEAERHFDQQATPVGPWAPGLSGRMSIRTNVMGDSLLAVVEVWDPAGRWDTVRVVAPSTAAAAGWLGDLVGAVAARLGGPSTHAGATLLGWRPNLVEAFAPTDVSYLSDQLTAQRARPADLREPVDVRGSWVGRNAILAATVRVGAEPPLQTLPLGFPVLLDRAVGIAGDRADLAASGQDQVSLRAGRSVRGPRREPPRNP